MNCLVDAQLPSGLARWLADQGHSAQHVNDVGLADAEDFVIWNHALGVDAIIVTKDDDFAERTARTAVGPVIVWLRIGNATNRALLEWLEPRWSSVVQLLIDGNRLIEVLIQLNYKSFSRRYGRREILGRQIPSAFFHI